MAKILINEEIYNELSVESLYEYEFETLFVDQCSKLFPDFYIASFKYRVESPEGNGIPDLALIDKNYTTWWVVEVEKSSHPLESHVLKQVRIFSNAQYDEGVADALSKANPHLNLDKLNKMLLGSQPNVLIVVDTPKPEWVSSFKRYDALLCVFQVFRSQKNNHIYRINGQSPKSFQSLFTECYFDKLLANYLTIKSPAIIDEPNQGKLTIIYKESISEWKRMDIKNKVFLIPVSKNPLRLGVLYTLYKNSDNTYYITEK